MLMRKIRLPLIGLAVLSLSASVVWAIGFQFGQSKEELKLDYTVSVTDHGTGRVTAVLTIADQGRLKPLLGVHLMVASEKKGEGYVDLSVPLAVSEENGKEVVRVHLKKELADRAEIQLRTAGLDGKKEPSTWYYYSIRLAKHMKKQEKKE